MRLFLDDHPELVDHFRKEAGFTYRLSEMPENWPQEVGSELVKQLPFLSDYDVSVNLEKQEPGRGFAFGYADISNRTERPEVEHEQAGIPHIRIPIVAEDRQVRPFSVFMDGERVLPMSEERIRETLFNPSTFDLSTAAPYDPSLVEALMPPQRSGIGMGGEYKMASVKNYVQKHVNSVAEGAAKHVGKKYAPHVAGAVAGTSAAVGGASYLGAKAGSKSKTAFKHVSKDQWDAIYKSDKIRKLVQKHGVSSHPEVTNAVYELAAKTYGYHPKVYPPGPKQLADEAMKETEKMKKKQQGLQEQLKKSQTGGMAKKASLLKAIAPTIREKDRDAFVEKIAADPNLRVGFRRSGIAKDLVEVMDTKLASVSDRLDALSEAIPPSVVTFQKLPGGDFLVKAASVTAFENNTSAKGEVLPFSEVAEAIGEDTAKSMQPGQVATAVSDPIKLQDTAQGNTFKSVSDFGAYTVQDADGNGLKGYVFPQVLSWDKDLSPQSTALFMNSGTHAIQDGVVGESLKTDYKLPTDIPKGEGVFWGKDGIATSPLNIKFGITGSDGVSRYTGTDTFGNEVKVAIVPGLKEPKALSETEFAIPSDWSFTRLNKKVNLSKSVGTADKVKKEKTSAILFYNGSYNIKGGCGLDKVASELRQDMDAVGAEFILGILGVDGVTAKQKVAEARKRGQVEFSGLKTVQLLSERFEESIKTASELLTTLPNLKRDLIKEAAAMEDPGTVDKILALNFINPENLSTFIEYLPELEESNERMAEMVLAGYLGMKEIPIAAVERAMHNMEEVLEGLKAVQHSQES
jgi:hypothetical protein